jgi:hypothetical protein
MNIIKEYYEAENDNFTKHYPDDTRKVHLSLRHLNLLRKRRELQNLENQARIERLKLIYGTSSDEGGGDFGL